MSSETSVEKLAALLGNATTLEFQFFAETNRSPSIPPWQAIAEDDDGRQIFDAYSGWTVTEAAENAIAGYPDWGHRVPAEYPFPSPGRMMVEQAICDTLPKRLSEGAKQARVKRIIEALDEVGALRWE